jgi:hypothetical protein
LLGWSVSLPEHVLRFAPALLTSAMAATLWVGIRKVRAAAVAAQAAVPERV